MVNQTREIIDMDLKKMLTKIKNLDLSVLKFFCFIVGIVIICVSISGVKNMTEPAIWFVLGLILTVFGWL